MFCWHCWFNSCPHHFWEPQHFGQSQFSATQITAESHGTQPFHFPHFPILIAAFCYILEFQYDIMTIDWPSHILFKYSPQMTVTSQNLGLHYEYFPFTLQLCLWSVTVLLCLVYSSDTSFLIIHRLMGYWKSDKSDQSWHLPTRVYIMASITLWVIYI